MSWLVQLKRRRAILVEAGVCVVGALKGVQKLSPSNV
jgi:hypothetical protein